MTVKRFLSIVMIICLVFCTAVSALAENTLVIREKVIFDLQSYGILQGTENGELELDRNVTRAEFCAFVARMMGVENFPYSEGFKDVTRDAWYAQDVSAMVAYGIIDGNQDGEFRPDDNISYIDAMKILVCALGYRVQAEAAGGYPQGYQSVGTKLKINNGVSVEPTAYLTRGAVILMLYNALDAEILESVPSGESMSYKLSGKTFRSLFGENNNDRSIHMSTGIVTADYYTFLLEPIAGIELGEVEINGTVYDAAQTNAAEFLGMEVEYYYKDTENGKPTLVSCRLTSDNKFCTIQSKDIDSINANILNYYENNKRMRAKLSDSFYIVKNRQIMTRNDNITTGEDLCKNGTVKLIDNNGDNVYDLAVVEDYNSYRVSKVYENGLFTADGKLFDGRRFIEMDPDDEDVKIILENREGEKINLSDIAENDVVSLFQSEDKSVLKCVKGLEPVSGRLSSVNNDGQVVIDNVTYECDYYFKNDVQAGDLVIAYLDFRGYIVELERDKSASKQYAYIISGAELEGEDTFQLKVLIPGNLKPEIEIDDTDEDQILEVPVLKAYNDKVTRLTVAPKITVDGVRMEESEYSQIFSKSNLDAAPDNRLISYKTNSEGIIASIESPERIGNGGYKVYNAYENVFGKEGSEGFGITEDSVVICVPEDGVDSVAEEDLYASLLMNNAQRYRITGYDIDDDSSNANIVVITDSMDLNAGDVINSKSKLAVVSDKSTIWDEEEDEVRTKLEFYSEGKKMSYIVAEDSEAAPIAESMKFGDVFYYALNNIDEIYRLSVCDLGRLGDNPVFGDRGSNDTERSIFGEIENIDYNIIDLYKNRRVNRLTVRINENLDSVSYGVNRRNTPFIYVIEGKNVKVGSIDDIYIGGGAVFAHIKEDSLKGIVVVR